MLPLRMNVRSEAPKPIAQEGGGSTGLGGFPASQTKFLRSARPAEAATNFERPFTPRTSLRSPRNFGNARFKRFATFDFLTPKNVFRKIFREFFFRFFRDFRPILEELGSF